jgi:hypothetical protein
MLFYFLLIMSRTIVCSKVHDDFPNSAVLGGHSTFSAAVTVCLEAAAVVWLRVCACLSMEVMSSQAGRSQSSISEENAGGVDRSLEAFGGSVVPVILIMMVLHIYGAAMVRMEFSMTKIFRALFLNTHFFFRSRAFPCRRASR